MECVGMLATVGIALFERDRFRFRFPSEQEHLIGSVRGACLFSLGIFSICFPFTSDTEQPFGGGDRYPVGQPVG